MIYFISVAAIQLAEVSTPLPAKEKLIMMQHKPESLKVKNAGRHQGSGSEKVILAKSENIPHAYDVISQGKALSEMATRSNARSVYNPILIPNCQRTSSNPAGSPRTLDKILNGRINFFRCDNFAVVVSIFDLSSPTNPAAISLIKDEYLDAEINNGYRSTSVFQSPDNKIEVNVNWLSKLKSKEVTINFYGKNTSVDAIKAKSYDLLDFLTK